MTKKIYNYRTIKSAAVASCLSMSLIMATNGLAASTNDSTIYSKSTYEQDTRTLQQALANPKNNLTSTDSKEVAYNVGLLMFYPMTQLAHIMRYTLDTRPTVLNKYIQNEVLRTNSAQARSNAYLQSLFYYDQVGLETEPTATMLQNEDPATMLEYFYQLHTPGYLMYQSTDNNQLSLAKDIQSDFYNVDPSNKQGLNEEILSVDGTNGNPLIVCPPGYQPATPPKSTGKWTSGVTYIPPVCYPVTAQTLLGTTEYKYDNKAQQHAAETFTSLASGSYFGLKAPDASWYSSDNITSAPIARYIAFYNTVRSIKSVGAYNMSHAYAVRSPGDGPDKPSALQQYNQLLAKMANNPEFWSRMNRVPVVGQLTIIADYMPILALGIARQNQQLEMMNNSLAAMLVAQSLLLDQAGTRLYSEASKQAGKNDDAQSSSDESTDDTTNTGDTSDDNGGNNGDDSGATTDNNGTDTTDYNSTDYNSTDYDTTGTGTGTNTGTDNNTGTGSVR